jgi:hypothetical protein
MLTLIKGDAKVSSKSKAALTIIDGLSEEDYALMRIKRILWDAIRNDADYSDRLRSENPEMFADLSNTIK